MEEKPAAVGPVEAAHIIGVSRSTFLRIDANGKLGPRSFRLSHRRLWLRHELYEWLEEAATTGHAPTRREWLERKKRK